jgi:hypothetical protein
MRIEDMYDEQYWHDLIEVIVQRMGADKFLLLSLTILYEMGHRNITKNIIIEQINSLDKLTKQLKKKD